MICIPLFHEPQPNKHNAAAVAIKLWWQQSTPLIPHAQQFVMHES